MSTFVVPANMYESHNAYRRLQLNICMDDVKTSIIEVRTFLKIYPDVAIACNDLGVLYYRDGEKLLALACYEKANRLQPGTPDIVKNLAEFYFVELGWTDDAILMLTELLRSHPDDCDLLIKLGVISERVGRDKEAGIFYRKAMEIDPCNNAVREALCRVGDTPAPSSAVSAADITPIEAEPVTQAAQTESGHLEDILAGLRKKFGQSQHPDETAADFTPTSDQLLAESRKDAENGDLSGAAGKLEQAIGADPGNAMAHNDLGVVYTRMGNFGKASFHHENAVRLNPSDAVFRKNLASLYYSCLGRTDEAISIYTNLLKELPNDVETLSALAIISKDNNLRDQARTFIGRVINLEPCNDNAREFLAGI